MDAARLVRALKRAGFVELAQKGSHLALKHPLTGRRTTIPIHGGDVSRPLLKQILKQTGLSEDDFRNL